MALAAAPLLRLPISPPSPPPAQTPPPLLACNSVNGVRLRPQRSRQPRRAAAAAATASLVLRLALFLSWWEVRCAGLTPRAACLQAADTERRKHELLRAVQETGRGFAASPDQRASIEEAIVRDRRPLHI
jgi:hypothetical protein